MAKNIKKTETKELSEVQKKEKKWGAGKYKFLKSYCGLFGTFDAGSVYELSEVQANAFGKNGEIEACS